MPSNVHPLEYRDKLSRLTPGPGHKDKTGATRKSSAPTIRDAALSAGLTSSGEENKPEGTGGTGLGWMWFSEGDESAKQVCSLVSCDILLVSMF